MIEIKRLDGTTVHTIDDVPEGALVHRELMADHYVKLLFSLAEPIYLHLGDYIDLPNFGRFELTVPYAPKYNSETAGYDYTLQLDAYYIKWKNKKVRYMPTASASETSFNLTATIAVHLNVIVSGINAIGNRDTSFKFEGTTAFRYELKNFPADKVLTAKYKRYDNTDFISALNDLANIFEGEWWVEDNTIFFGKCKIEGEEIDFELDSNVEDMSGSASKNEYATRIIAFGAARNLPPDYRKDSSADVTVNGIVQKRLMLPLVKCPNGYVQDDSVLNEAEAIEAILVDESIYPRTKCIVDRVETYTDTAEDENTGETITQTFYRLYDGSGFVFSTDYILEGETLHIQFQSGHMNGMDFECQYNDEHGYYEVVVNEEYGRPLPDENLHPEVDDEFVLYGWDSTKIGSTGLIDAAEEELYQATVAKLQDMKIDPNTYNCTLRSDWYEDKMERESLSTYSMGQPVRLINPTYFANGRSSRIIGYEVKLDFIYDKPMYIVGEARAYSRSQKMEEQLDSITYNGASYKGSGSGGGGVYLITSTSSTPSSDSNVYSAKRSDKQFLRRDKDDTAYGVVTFDKDTKFRNGLGSNDFAQGEFGAGYHMGKYGNTNDSYLEIDRLLVRKMAYYVSLAIKRLDHVGGSVGVSPADLTISNVEVLDDVYRCYVDLTDGHSTINIEDWQVGDLARCQTFNVNQATYYWRAVDNVDYQNGYVDLSIEDCDAGSGIPKRGDVLVVVGNKTDATRQNFIEISSTGSSSPSIKIYHGIDDYSLDEKDATSFEYDPTTGRMKMVVYGDMYVGNRLGTNYIKYDQTNGVQIRANAISMKVTEQGQDVYKGIEEIIQEISQQGDGSFIVWRSETDDEPSSESEPESEWTTDEIRDEHVGDIYLNSEGLCWEYKYNPVSGYFWDIVSDQYLIESLRKVREKARCFAGVYGTNTPTSGEYSKNDLWVDATYSTTYTHDLLVCIRNGSWDNFSITDWALAANYSDKIQDAIDAINDFKDEVQAQVDGKADSYYQATDPSESWTDLESHVGDLWYNTTTKTSSVWGEDEDVTNPLGYKWFESSVDLEPFIHKYDGKASIFYGDSESHPTVPYNAHDFWLLSNPVTIVYQDGAKTYDAGTILVSLATRDENSQYYATDWVDILKYTDGKALQMFINNEYRPFVQDISEQLDGVAESYITTSSTDPSTNWTSEEKASHKGDIWVQEDTGLSYYWTGARWIQSSISLSELTDKTDGKATIFVSIPNQKRTNADGEIIDDGYLYRVNDLWILESDSVYSGYESGTIMVATSSSNTSYSASHWVKKDCYTNGMNEDDKDALLDAGIDIVNGEIIATSDRFKFQNRQGTEVAVFEEVGGKGYLRTDMIHADELVTKKVVATDDNGNVLSIYNGNGNGTIVYYYPDGSKMKEDIFVRNQSTGAITGMKTRYYNPDGSLAWELTESGDIGKNLHYYWDSLGVCGVTTVTTVNALSNVVKQWSTGVPSNLQKRLSQFVADSSDQQMYAYNGLTCYGDYDGVTPTHSTVVGNELTGYMTFEPVPQSVGDEDYVDGEGNFLDGYFFGHYTNGYCDGVPDKYFVATNGWVWDNETKQRLV